MISDEVLFGTQDISKTDLMIEYKSLARKLMSLESEIYSKHLTSKEVNESFEESHKDLMHLESILEQSNKQYINWREVESEQIDKSLLNLYNNINFIQYWSGLDYAKSKH
tara:strand:+ start:46064 stop:46393 length:330 start_codon:yes stop_codon:yes gene_type:complete